MMGFLNWLHRRGPCKSSRCDLRAAADEISQKERELAVLKMKREAAQAELQEAFRDLLKIKEPENGDP